MYKDAAISFYIDLCVCFDEGVHLEQSNASNVCAIINLYKEHSLN